MQTNYDALDASQAARPTLYLPNGFLLGTWRVAYWLTFVLTWYSSGLCAPVLTT